MLKALLHETRDKVLRPEPCLRLYLKLRYGARPTGQKPRVDWQNSALGSRQEWVSATHEVQRLGLPSHVAAPKNWDGLAALNAILEATTPEAFVLDAGGEKYSQILPWLYLYGYRNLYCLNLAFTRPTKWGPISYEPGDITQTRFANATFNAVTCLSVIEHGVDVGAFFKEASRILKNNGLLVLSLDYFPEPIDTRGQRAFGAPIHVFDADEVKHLVSVAKQNGLEPTSEVECSCEEKPVRWDEFALDFSYLTITFKKRLTTTHGTRN